MTLSSKRAVIGILSVITFLALSFLIAHYLHKETYYYHSPLGVWLIISINASIFFAFLAFGILYGVAFAIICIITIIWFSLRAGPSLYSMAPLTYVAAAYIGYRCIKESNLMDTSFNMKLEKMTEESNLAANIIKIKKESIGALKEKLARYETLKGVIESLSTHLSVEDLGALIVENAGRTIYKHSRILFYVVDMNRQDLMLFASRGDMKVKEKKGDMFDYWVLRRRKPLFIEDLSKDFRFSSEDSGNALGNFSSLISVPLISGNKILGILRMDSPEAALFTQDDLRLLNIISDFGGVTLHNAMLYARAQELAITDSLTGLYVRRYFMERLGEEIKRTALKKASLAVLMIDIDNFKNYNDKYGHTSGDLVLKHLARTIRQMAVEGDIVARYGGEEIVVLLTGKGLRAAAALADEMRRAVKERPLNLRRHETEVTVSIGVSCCPDDAAEADELLKIADARLYKAKNAGRNRVCAS